MKKFMFLAIVAMFATFNVFADNNVKCTNIQAEDLYNCRVSLERTSVYVYTEVTPYGSGDSWVEATVLINCPQDNDIYVTVSAYYGREHIGSGVVTIPAGKTKSEPTRIYVDNSNINGRVNLRIE